ncbi:MAG: hypothetical protein AWT59_3028 [Candidatus Gallionella acididurans]|uniref:Uncharacterized protein n=1 Tax=Candidatus Gallionella acididurans TaxID=1796491 RepID=A0A139BPI0_9PROT|nr:MAG: hypothetical protein AWT59_3028 [Candidatus Gallionella acididurans]
MKKIMHLLQNCVFFCLTFAFASIAYCGEFDADIENAKLQRGDWSFLKKLPGKDGQSLYNVLKSNQLKVSKTSEDIYCMPRQMANAKVPEGCYFGFRIQRSVYKDEYCSPNVGCAPCGLSMVYFQRPGDKQFVPYSTAARYLAGGALSAGLLLSDGDYKNAAIYKERNSIRGFLSLIDGDNRRFCSSQD